MTREERLPANHNPILPNVHPVDKLQDLRKQIKALEDEADKLRGPLLEDGADLDGDLYTGKVIESKRETIDTKAIIEAFGEKAIAPYLKTTQYKTLKIVEK